MATQILGTHLTPREALAALRKAGYVLIWSDVFDCYVRFTKRECKATLEAMPYTVPLNILLAKNGSGHTYLQIG